MSLLKLPEIRADMVPLSGFDAPLEGLDKWVPEIQAKETDNSIGIYDGIGENWDGTGVTAKRISAALRAIGDQEVVVNINSPGGNYFEGVAIYNLLKNHPAKVTVNVIGVAASAASIIAMAGDEILMGESANIMIHNAMGVAFGNKQEMQSTIDLLARLDEDMADVYVARTGQIKTSIQAMMDAETWLSADDSLDKGFATGHMPSSMLRETTAQAGQTLRNSSYLRAIENGLKREGKTRSQRREIMSQLFSSKPGAADDPSVTLGADNTELLASMQALLNSLKGN